jgi:hypothetical protein
MTVRLDVLTSHPRRQPRISCPNRAPRSKVLRPPPCGGLLAPTLRALFFLQFRRLDRCLSQATSPDSDRTALQALSSSVNPTDVTSVNDGQNQIISAEKHGPIARYCNYEHTLCDRGCAPR